MVDLRAIETRFNSSTPKIQWRIAFPELKYILLLFLSTRIILTFVGVLSRIFLGPFHLFPEYSDKFWLSIWGVWDTGYYLDIATNGYSATVNEGGYVNYVFFPLYPYLMKLLGSITHDFYISGIIISNICTLISCIFLYKLVILDETHDTALRSIKYLMLFPTSFILSGVFTESLFLALALSCFYFARKGNWFCVGAIGFWLSLTRSLGFFIILPMLYEYLKSKPISKDLLYLLLIPSGLFVFMGYNYYLTGDLLAFSHAQSLWGRQLMNPLSYLYQALSLSQNHQGYGTTQYFCIAIFTILLLLLFIAFYNRIRFSYLIFSIYSIVIPLSTGLASMPRFALVVFPFFILLSQLTKKYYIDNIATVSLALLQGFLMVFWTNNFVFII